MKTFCLFIRAAASYAFPSGEGGPPKVVDEEDCKAGRRSKKGDTLQKQNISFSFSVMPKYETKMQSGRADFEQKFSFSDREAY